jgi:hypothetical protein
MSYNTYTETRVLPTYEFTLGQSYTSFMKVGEVLQWLVENTKKYAERQREHKAVALPIQQYKLGNEPTHYFKVEDIKEYLNDTLLLHCMECKVLTYMVKVKE